MVLGGTRLWEMTAWVPQRTGYGEARFMNTHEEKVRQNGMIFYDLVMSYEKG